MLNVNELPNDPAVLKRLVAEREEAFRIERETLLANNKTLIDRIKQEAAEQMEALQKRLEAEHKAVVDAILRRYYGPRCEKFDPRQLLLFGMTVDELPLDEASIEDESGEPLVTRRVKNRHKHGRRQLPEHLERIEIEHDLGDDEKACPACGTQRERIGAEVSEQLEYFPANFKVLKHIRHKYGCPHCEHDGYNPNIATAAKPAQPIEKGLPGPSLLAHVITSKLGDHLPLYRLEKIFARHQVDIARSTMCAWMRAAGELVTPLVDLMTGLVRQSANIHTDDTGVPVQSPGAKQCRKGRIWCYLGDGLHPYVVYDYTPDWSRAGPAGWLDGYRGYLQADGYSGYDGIYAGGDVTEVACWAHARRKFYDAQDSDGRRSAEMLSLIGKLYKVEREAKELDADARLALRQTKSVPILEQIKGWLDTEGRNRSAAQPDEQSDHLRPKPMGRPVRLHHARLLGDRQQRRRTRVEACRPGSQELAFCGQRRSGGESREALEPDRQLRTPRHRPTALPHQRPGQAPDHAGRRVGAVPAGCMEKGRRGGAGARRTTQNLTKPSRPASGAFFSTQPVPFLLHVTMGFAERTRPIPNPQSLIPSPTPTTPTATERVPLSACQAVPT